MNRQEEIIYQNVMHRTARKRQEELNGMSVGQRFSVTESGLERYDLGRLIEGRGIYVGTWQPKDKQGNTLGKTFNIFAMPEDLPNTMKPLDSTTMRYKTATELVSWERGKHGDFGGRYVNDEVLYEALKNGDYKGEWIVPPRELLTGRDGAGNIVAPDNIFAHKDKGAFRGSFNTGASTEKETPSFYWSSAADGSGQAQAVRLSDGKEALLSEETYISCRPVRLELKP